MDCNGNINWEYLGLIATLAILVGGFIFGAAFLLSEWGRIRRNRRWDQELNGDGAPADIVDIPKQREGDDE